MFIIFNKRQIVHWSELIFASSFYPSLLGNWSFNDNNSLILASSFSYCSLICLSFSSFWDYKTSWGWLKNSFLLEWSSYSALFSLLRPPVVLGYWSSEIWIIGMTYVASFTTLLSFWPPVVLGYWSWEIWINWLIYVGSFVTCVSFWPPVVLKVCGSSVVMLLFIWFYASSYLSL